MNLRKQFTPSWGLALLLAFVASAAFSTSASAQSQDKTEKAFNSTYIIQLMDEPLVSYRGGVKGYTATSPEVTGEKLLDVKSPASLAYLKYLEQKQQEFIQILKKHLRNNPVVVFQYKNSFHGIAVKLSHEEAKTVHQLPGVKSIKADLEYKLENRNWKVQNNMIQAINIQSIDLGEAKQKTKQFLQQQGLAFWSFLGTSLLFLGGVGFWKRRKKQKIANKNTLSFMVLSLLIFFFCSLSFSLEVFAKQQEAYRGLYILQFQDPALINAPLQKREAYQNFLRQTQEEVQQKIETRLGHPLQINYYYDVVFNGIAAQLTSQEAALIAQLPEVLSIEPNTIFQISTSRQVSSSSFPASRAPFKVYRPSSSISLSLIKNPFFWIAIASGFILFLFLIRQPLLRLRERFLPKKNSRILLFSIISFILMVALVACKSEDDEDEFFDSGSSSSSSSNSSTTFSNLGGYSWIGAPGVWDASQTGMPTGTKGEGIVIGVIGTGIDPSHPSFAEKGDDSYQHLNQRNRRYGICDINDASYDSSFPCNAKLIGAYGYPNTNTSSSYPDSPYDVNGEGTHMASIAAGNLVENANLTTENGYSLTQNLAGVAPHANLIIYNACCDNASLLAAINQATADGVDVISYSTGSTAVTYNPWQHSNTIAWLNARAAGIFVAVGAGDNGLNSSSLSILPADVPWVMTVGASSHDLAYTNTLTNFGGDSTVDISTIQGSALSNSYGSAKIVYAGDYNNAYCLSPNPENSDDETGDFSSSFLGSEIVVCDVGKISNIDKGKYVKDSGAKGMVLVETDANSGVQGAIPTEPHILPAIHIQYSDGVILKTWLNSGSTHTAQITQTTVASSSTGADVAASFSGRGPSLSIPSIIKPDVTAPGRAIFAAHCNSYCDSTSDRTLGQYNILQGTAAAASQVAGAAALLTSIHPGWTPAEIQSALIMTSTSGQWKSDGETSADAFDVGAGRINIPAAARAGLVMNETKTNYEAANPLVNSGDPSTLNTVIIGNENCVADCSWSRTLRNPTNQSLDWTISTETPDSSLSISVTDSNGNALSSLSFSPYQEQTIIVKATYSGVETGKWFFGDVILTETNNKASVARLPIAAMISISDINSSYSITTVKSSDSSAISGVKTISITALNKKVYGLIQADTTTDALVSDPTNKDPYDGLGDATHDTMFVTITVPADSKRLVAQTSNSLSSDLDIYLGTGATPSSATLITSSQQGGADEYISIQDPTADTYWILVQNWQSGYDTAQSFNLHYAVVPNTDAANMTVTATDQGGDGKFNLSIGWTGLSSGYWYGRFDLGSNNTDSSTEGNLGKVDVNLIHQ